MAGSLKLACAAAGGASGAAARQAPLLQPLAGASGTIAGGPLSPTSEVETGSKAEPLAVPAAPGDSGGNIACHARGFCAGCGIGGRLPRTVVLPNVAVR